MSKKIILYQFKSENISIHITARFENGDLIVEGYDIGKTVKDYWGDSDYEYMVTVKKKHIPALCNALGIENNTDKEILKAIAGRFKGNHCFSEFRDFLERHDIVSEGFSWT